MQVCCPAIVSFTSSILQSSKHALPPNVRHPNYIPHLPHRRTPTTTLDPASTAAHQRYIPVRSRDCFSSRFLIFQVTIPQVSLLLLPSTPMILFCRLRVHLATFELRRFSMNRLTCRLTVPTISHAIRSAKTRRWCPARDSGTSRSTSGVRSRGNITCHLIMTRLQPPLFMFVG